MAARTIHQHEKWMIRESASGGHYCAACGDRTDAEGQPLEEPAEPRVITTEEEARALPDRTVIADSYSTGAGIWQNMKGVWCTPGVAYEFAPHSIVYPAVVIWTPEEAHRG